jgi:hypothetical protein
MSIFLKRYFWIVPLVTTMLCSYLAARGAEVVDAKIAGDDDAPKLLPSRPRTVLPPPTPARSKDAKVIVDRNMFCSGCVPIYPPPPPPPGGEIPTTSLPLILSATVVASIPSFSSATIINTASFKAGSYGAGTRSPTQGGSSSSCPSMSTS